MRVLLVYANKSRDLTPAPPIGLSYVASAAAASGHEVAVVDLLVAGDGESALRRALRTHRPEVVGGLMAEDCAELLKRFFQSRRVAP